MSELELGVYGNVCEDSFISYEESGRSIQYSDAENIASSRKIFRGEFFQKIEPYKEVNIFVCGVTEKSEKFISELNANYAKLLYGKGVKLRLIGVSDDNNFIFVPNGVNMQYYKESLNGIESICSTRKMYGLLESLLLENIFFGE